MNKIIRWLSVFLAVSMLFMSLNVNVFAEEDTMDNQANDEPLVADYPEGVVENNIPLRSTEATETENNHRASTAVIEVGVYAIMSYSYTYRWITIENDSPWEDANVQQEYSSSYPTTSFDRSSLFKISRVGTTDRYIIRSMVNNRMTIDLTSDGKVITKKIPAADSSVNISDTFFIETDGAGYYLRPYGYAYVINMVSTSTANLSTTLKSSATSSAKWTFVKYTGESKNGMTLYRPASWGSIGNVVGNTSNATLVGWSTHINANTLSMDIKSGYEDLGTLSWSSSTSKMTLVAENPGQIRINGRIKYANGTEVYSGYFSHMIVPQEGTYYIQNAGTEKYIDIEGPSYSSGATVQQWQFHTGNQEKWIIEHVENSGGYIRLKSVYSGHYIGVDSSNTSAIKQYSYQNNYTLWKIDRSSAGNLILICKGTESTGVVLAVPLNANSNGTDLTQIAYTDNTNYRDEWFLLSNNVYIEFRYDNGYITRNKKLLETTATTRNRISDNIIEEYFPNVHAAFAQRCNLNMVLNQTVIPLYYSDADLCDDDIDEYCNCISETECLLEYYRNPNNNNSTAGFEYGVHCKSMTRIRNNLITNIPDNTIRVAYTGHVACFYSSGEHETNVVGLSDYDYPIISMRESQSDRKRSILVLAHELTHSYGIVHHENVTGTTCIMDSKRYTYNDPDDYSTYWCPTCINTIKDNAGKY